MHRRMLLLLIVAATVVTPVATSEAVADPVAPGIPECPEPDPETGEYPPFEDPVCVSEGEEERGDPTHLLCVSDRFFPLWTGGPVVCARTYHWRYLPGPGACVWLLDDFNGPSLACVNGPANGWDGCLLTVMAASVLCE